MSTLPLARITANRARIAAAVATAALALGAAADTAAAKGGGTPAQPTNAPLDCFGDFGDPTIPNMTAPDVAVNYASNAGCVGAKVSGNSLSLAWVLVADGWSYTVNNSGSGGRVDITFKHAATGSLVKFRMEPGKTVVS